MIVDFTNPQTLLNYLSGLIGAVAWMMYFSNAVRNMRNEDIAKMSPAGAKVALWIRNLKPMQLQEFVFIVSVGVPLLAWVIVTYVPSQYIVAAQPAFTFLAKLLLAYIGQQIWFKAADSSSNKSKVEVKTENAATQVTVGTSATETTNAVG